MYRLILAFIIIASILHVSCRSGPSQGEFDDLAARVSGLEAGNADLIAKNEELAGDNAELLEEIAGLNRKLIPSPASDLYRGNIERAVKYLESMYSPDLRLVKEAIGAGTWDMSSDFEWVVFPPEGMSATWLMDNMYWLGDSAFVWMALQPYNPEMSESIRTKLSQPGIAEYASSDMPDLLSGKRLEYDPRRIQKKVYIDHVENEYLIVGGERTDDVLLPVEDYADVMMQYSIQAWRDGDHELAVQYLEQVLEIWDGTGIWDAPAMTDGFHEGSEKNEAAIYKLALLLITVQVLDYHFPYFHEVEQRIWENQDQEAGGIRTGIKANGSIGGGSNTETTSLVLLIYDKDRIEMLRRPFDEN